MSNATATASANATTSAPPTTATTSKLSRPGGKRPKVHPQKQKVSRIPHRVVVAGIAIPETKVWSWWLRLIKQDEAELPFQRSIIANAVLDIGAYVKRRGFRFSY